MSATAKLPPPSKIEKHIDSLSSVERGELAEELSGQIQRLVWNWGYMESRYGSGCGDQGHRSAVKNANRVLRQVRKAMGYTYPERGEIHV